MKKWLILLVVLVVLLFPFPMKIKDGGSVCYVPLSRIYRVYVYDATLSSAEGEEEFLRGTRIYLFNQVVYDTTNIVTESK